MRVKFPVDKYASVPELEHRAGKDAYKVRLLDRKSAVTIISPHGGFVEPGTSAVTRAVAGRQYNLFDFQGLKTPGAFELHVTSTRFRHPALSQLLAASRAALSIHSMGNIGTSAIWLGGRNNRLKQLTLAKLRASGFVVEPESPYFRGESLTNIVNMCADHGVQLELSRELLDDVFIGPGFIPDSQPRTTERFDSLVSALRRALRDYLSASQKIGD
jgi:phage replication-related protein YjqB (UPF0714/DUF867 family)